MSADLEPVSYRTARGPRTWDELRAEALAAVTAVASHVTNGVALGQAEDFADAVLALLDDEALNRMGEQYADEAKIKALEWRDGVTTLTLEHAQRSPGDARRAGRGQGGG